MGVFEDLIAQQGAGAREIEQRFGRLDHEIEIDMTDAELAILEDRIASGGNLGRAARQLLDRAVAEAEAKEQEGAASADNLTPDRSGATGDAGAKGAGGLAKTVGKQADAAFQAEALCKAETRNQA